MRWWWGERKRGGGGDGLQAGQAATTMGHRSAAMAAAPPLGDARPKRRKLARCPKRTTLRARTCSGASCAASSSVTCVVRKTEHTKLSPLRRYSGARTLTLTRRALTGTTTPPGRCRPHPPLLSPPPPPAPPPPPLLLLRRRPRQLRRLAAAPEPLRSPAAAPASACPTRCGSGRRPPRARRHGGACDRACAASACAPWHTRNEGAPLV